MQLSSPHCESRLFQLPDDIGQAFQNIERAALDDHPFVVLDDVSDFCCGFMQALRQEAGYWVEFRHGQTHRHYRTPDPVSQEAALALFVEFLQTGMDVLNAHCWQDVTEDVRRAIEKWSGNARVS